MPTSTGRDIALILHVEALPIPARMVVGVEQNPITEISVHFYLLFCNGFCARKNCSSTMPYFILYL